MHQIYTITCSPFFGPPSGCPCFGFNFSHHTFHIGYTEFQNFQVIEMKREKNSMKAIDWVVVLTITKKSIINESWAHNPTNQIR